MPGVSRPLPFAADRSTAVEEGQKINHTQRAYDEIRARVVTCWFEPGSPIGIINLHRDFGLSLASIREALSKLTAEGLVNFQTNNGFRSTPVARDRFGMIMAACRAVELPLLSAAILSGDHDWEDALIAFAHVGARTMSTDAPNQAGELRYMRAREMISARLFAASANDSLVRIWRQVHAQQSRFLYRFADRRRLGKDVHDVLCRALEAAAARDGARAADAWGEYQDLLTRLVIG